MKKRILGVITTIMVLTLAAGAVSAEQPLDAAYMDGVFRFIEDTYFLPVDRQELNRESLTALFTGLDDYTAFYTPEEARHLIDRVTGQYEGIGITMIPGDPYVVVAQVFAGSPAEEAGVLPGDFIVSVDGVDLSGATLEEVAALLRGPADTSVRVELRTESGSPRIAKVVRSEIRINPVHLQWFDNAAYIRVDAFNGNSGDSMQQALDEIDRRGITRVLLDLRGNGGGSVEEAVQIARRLVPQGVITRVDFRCAEDILYTSDLDQSHYRLVVLVDDLTASASEILAGAIQDHKAGTLVGSQTYGKARVQDLIPILNPEAYERYRRQYGIQSVDMRKLRDQHQVIPRQSELMGWVKITTGTYVTPRGENIDEKGLTPDYLIEPGQEVEGIELSALRHLELRNRLTLHSRSMEVYWAEQILHLSGYLQGEPDFSYGEDTCRAVREFQAQQGLYPYGTLDFATQEHLNRWLHGKLLTTDPIYQKGWELLSS